MKKNRPHRVLVTRSPHQASELAQRLRDLELEPVLLPVIEIAEPISFAALDEALAQLESFHWIVFTSTNAVEAAHRRGLHPQRVRIAAIGQATVRALHSAGLDADLIPPQAVAESLAAELLPHAHQPDGSPSRFLLVRAEEARDILPESLHAAGAAVTIAPAYHNVIPVASIDAIRAMFSEPGSAPDAITFTSSSSVRHLLALCDTAGVKLPASALRVSIGPITSETMRELGYPPHAEALSASTSSLAQAVAEALKQTDAP